MNGIDDDRIFDDGLVAETAINKSDDGCLSLAVDDPTTFALQFLSTASPEAIVGVAVGLATCTYFVLGRFGLILMGVFAGVILHATWERQSITDRMSVRRENSLDVIKRILDLGGNNNKCGAVQNEEERYADDFETLQPETAAALRELVDAIIRDYVKSWYQQIIPKDTSFLAATQKCLSRFIFSISCHLSRKRPEDIFLDFLTNSSSIIIVFLSELSAALALSPGPATEAVYSYLFANPESSLANALDKQNQKKKLKIAASDILRNFLDKSIHECNPVRIFLNEILGSLVLESVLKSCSKPEWINGWIVFLLEEGESNLSQAIDAGMEKDRQDGGPTENTKNAGHAVSVPSLVSIPQREQNGILNSMKLSKSEQAIIEARKLSELIAEGEATKKNGLHSSLDPKTQELAASLEQINKSIDQISIKKLSEKPSLKRSSTHMVYTDTSKAKDVQGTNRSNLYKSTSLSGPHEVSASVSVLSEDPSFSNFDQINMDPVTGHRDGSPSADKKTVFPSLHNANITVYDGSPNPEKGKVQSKPKVDYLIQIEPVDSNHPGWMIVRHYTDFEALHEVLRRIAQVSGVTTFTESHHNIPSWREKTKSSLREELERYLRDACWYYPLAESEGMKRFFKKDQDQNSSASNSKNNFPGIGWSTPSAMGKGMLDVLTSAPKGVAESGKAITGVFSSIGNRGQRKSTYGQLETNAKFESVSPITTFQVGRASEDGYNSNSSVQTQPNRTLLQGQKMGYDATSLEENEPKTESTSTSVRSSISGSQRSGHSRDSTHQSSRKDSLNSSPIQITTDSLILPPPPTEMPDDYVSHSVNGTLLGHIRSISCCASVRTTGTEISSHHQSSIPSNPTEKKTKSASAATRRSQQPSIPITEDETRVAVELIFAVINEMYTISSAWNIRRTLLIAAKTYFLRPGNPSLLEIQSLIQDSVISANTSDAGIAAHLRKLRENCLPTEDELQEWPSEMTSEEKERLRIKARNLLIKQAVPRALTGVMGQVATSEAMGHIFDCLQIEEFTRGLLFGVLLQGLRSIFH
ncbi:putative px domain-containing protein [Golovinomyces cichoracearum]|uniref:Putative px domain-containing protein n=1 Tax=Golovinomyces cichoracearum TaxID=62708 RepID=A0A420J0H8_9PEZI|nr:putative px domain-containing protein [Golovinomyces cichoracearum]